MFKGAMKVQIKLSCEQTYFDKIKLSCEQTYFDK